MIPVIIRTCPGREEYAAYLREKLPEADWCIDTARDATGNFLAALTLGGDDPAIHLEDDVILTRFWRTKMHAVIAERPDDLIRMFSRTKDDLTRGSRWHRDFAYTQCFYVPRGFAPDAVAWCEANPDPRDGMFDRTLGRYLGSVGRRHWLHVPSLVQHRPGPSTLGAGHHSIGGSPTFTDPDE